MTNSLERAIAETNRRRDIQIAYNTKHGITPKTIQKEIHDIAESMRSDHDKTVSELLSIDRAIHKKNPKRFIKELKDRMALAVENLDFETAALIRDEIYVLEGKEVKKAPRKRRFGS